MSRKKDDAYARTHRDEWRVVKRWHHPHGEDYQYTLELVSWRAEEESVSISPFVKRLPTSPFGFSLKELRTDFAEMSKALDKPVLLYQEVMKLQLSEEH